MGGIAQPGSRCGGARPDRRSGRVERCGVPAAGAVDAVSPEGEPARRSRDAEASVHDRRDADRGLPCGRGAEFGHVRGRECGADGAVGTGEGESRWSMPSPSRCGRSPSRCAATLPHADGRASAALEASREEFTPTVRADTICTLARAWTLDERWSPAYVEALRQTYELMLDWGDEPRRARVGAMLVRFSSKRGSSTMRRRFCSTASMSRGA